MGQGADGGGRNGQYGPYGQQGRYGRSDDAPTGPVDGYGQYGAYGAATPQDPGTGGWGAPQQPNAWGPPQHPGGWGPPTAPGGPDRYGQFGMADAPGTGSWSTDSLAGGQPGIVPLRPLRFGDIFEGAFAAVRHNPATMFFYAGVAGVLGALLAIVPNWFASNATTTLTIEEASGVQALGTLVLAAVVALSSLAATSALVVSVSRSAIGDRVSIGQVWAAVKGRILALVGLSLLVLLIVWGLAILTAIVLGLVMVAVVAGLITTAPDSAGGVVAVVAVFVVFMAASAIPAFIVVARLSLAYPAVVLEKAGPGTALSRSWSLTRGATWRLVGIYLLTFLIAAVIAAVIGVPIVLLGDLLGLSPALVLIAVSVFDVLVGLVTTPFTAGVVSLVYIDQRMRREGLDVQLARAAASRG